MKPFIFANPKILFSLLVGILLIGCNEAESGPDNPEKGEDRYLMIRISEAGNPFSRSSTEFDEGSTEENAIHDVSFYLFNSDGSPYLMNYTGIGNESGSNRVMLQAETGDVLSRMLILGEPVNSANSLPSRLVAVANLGDDYQLSSLEKLSMTEFSQKILTSHPNKGSGIIMTSSTYFDINNRKIFWTDISSSNIHPAPSEAVSNPITVNLERIVAKITVTVNPTAGAADSQGRFKVARKIIIGDNATQEERELYAEVLGWDLNATSDLASLIKDIRPENVPFTGWNDPSYNRSYWATIPAGTNLDKRFNWGSLSRTIGSSTYCYENTMQPEAIHFQDASTDATKVLLKARITDAGGVAQDMVSVGGILYETRSLKRWIAASADPEEGDETQVRLVRREEAGKRHIVDAYYGEEKVEGFENLRHWEDGVCYYVANLRHTFTRADDSSVSEPVYGVVRNHSYILNINSIAGLGTPGGKDDHDTPENPERQIDTTVKAEVRILPWHLLSFDADVET